MGISYRGYILVYYCDPMEVYSDTGGFLKQIGPNHSKLDHFTIETSYRQGRWDLIRMAVPTVVNFCATSSKNTLNLKSSRVKQETLLCFREHCQMVGRCIGFYHIVRNSISLCLLHYPHLKYPSLIKHGN